MSLDLSKILTVYGMDKSNPLHTPAEDAPCIVCYKPLNNGGRIMRMGVQRPKDDFTYSISTHMKCWSNLSEADRQEYLDSISNNPVHVEDLHVPK